ncbi:MAG TPA: D-tyrosyl-tRNA(Tyr) deacylase [Candidatus Desulfofervidus auxilii]|uniref:D-aminoacyl-tRNA deacylase n=1 Tax=Desulfofervidus auxilii TaxID=1621989 RepID=A0A7V0IA65_DESA2|nr:D-tyrosyl-tRNA(Tyr) deacylase [Candidatus Desulfofervidus auxilii]
MKVVIQRVKKAKVLVNKEVVGEIDKGILILLGIAKGDTREQAEWLVKKICSLRIFPDEVGKFNLSLKDIGGKALIVSQFTLYGDCRKGRRPSFDKAASPKEAIPLYETFIEFFKKEGIPVATGKFGALMEIHLINDGPVTFVIER